jgi:16S rRNA (cytosine967-C5)-methyltransferase
VNAHGRDAAVAICEYGQREPDRGGLLVADAGLAAEEAVLMDDGSRLVAEIAAAAMPVVEGRIARVWDCCAAPGGKTLVLAKRLAAAEILASDVSERRMAQMAARLRRYAFAARVKTAVVDAAAVGASDERFDLILCDVPCSGTGTLARNPEIRRRLKPEEFTRQSARQRAILHGALGRLAPGGRQVAGGGRGVVDGDCGARWRAADATRGAPLRWVFRGGAGTRLSVGVTNLWRHSSPPGNLP